MEHIPIPGPTADNSYYNCKGYHSIILQAVCNAYMEFTDVYCGWPGSAHDSRVWQNSPLYLKLREPGQVAEEHHVIGDSAYRHIFNGSLQGQRSFK